MELKYFHNTEEIPGVVQEQTRWVWMGQAQH